MKEYIKKTFNHGTAQLEVENISGFIYLKLSVKHHARMTVSFVATPTEWQSYSNEILQDLKNSLRACQVKLGYTEVSVTGAA